MEKQLDLERLVKHLENTFINTPSRVLRKELDAARSALNQILTRKASLLFARQRLYEYGNKPGRLLARLARGRNEASYLLCTSCLCYYQWPSLSSFSVGVRYKARLPAVPSPFCFNSGTPCRDY